MAVRNPGLPGRAPTDSLASNEGPGYVEKAKKRRLLKSLDLVMTNGKFDDGNSSNYEREVRRKRRKPRRLSSAEDEPPRSLQQEEEEPDLEVNNEVQSSPNTSQVVDDNEPVISESLLLRNPKFSAEEDIQILDYIFDNSEHKRVKGVALWNEMADEGVCNQRSAQSMKERFRRHIIPNIEKYKGMIATKNWSSFKRLAESYGSNHEVSAIARSGERLPFKRDEDLKIIRFISQNSRYSEIKGIAMWNLMEAKNVVPARTAQSMKERFRKRILPSIRSYGLNSDVVRRFLRYA